MYITFKSYQIVKLKKYFKNNNFVFFYHLPKLSLTKWITIEQKLKKLKLNYSKPFNKTAIKIFKTSVFRNFNYNIIGFIFFINFQCNSNLIFMNQSFSFFLVLINLKLNHKIYSKLQLKGLTNLCYDKALFKLYKVLDKKLKISYILINNKKIRNNVI